jgi:hypothetical protein
MSEDHLLALREEFTRRNVLICFNGPVSHGLIEEIGTAVRRYLETEQGRVAAAADVFAAYVEFSQNMKQYLERKAFGPADHRAATILISRDAERYAVTAGNVVAAEDLPPLLARIDALRGLDAAELRRRYKEQLRRPSVPGQVGAGVGLLDVARRATGGLRTATWPLDPGHALFGVTATI